MKSGWTYSNDSGNREKLAPNTLAANVMMSENGPDLLDFIRDYTHPVGSIWMTSEDQDPNVLFGGTWTKIEDVFLLASGENVPAGTTGGEAVHTLTTEELPVHRHSAYGNDTSSGWFFSLIKSISGRSGKLAMVLFAYQEHFRTFREVGHGLWNRTIRLCLQQYLQRPGHAESDRYRR